LLVGLHTRWFTFAHTGYRLRGCSRGSGCRAVALTRTGLRWRCAVTTAPSPRTFRLLRFCATLYRTVLRLCLPYPVLVARSGCRVYARFLRLSALLPVGSYATHYRIFTTRYGSGFYRGLLLPRYICWFYAACTARLFCVCTTHGCAHNNTPRRVARLDRAPIHYWFRRRFHPLPPLPARLAHCCILLVLAGCARFCAYLRSRYYRTVPLRLRPFSWVRFLPYFGYTHTCCAGFKFIAHAYAATTPRAQHCRGLRLGFGFTPGFTMLPAGFFGFCRYWIRLLLRCRATARLPTATFIPRTVNMDLTQLHCRTRLVHALLRVRLPLLVCYGSHGLLALHWIFGLPRFTYTFHLVCWTLLRCWLHTALRFRCHRLRFCYTATYRIPGSVTTLHSLFSLRTTAVSLLGCAPRITAWIAVRTWFCRFAFTAVRCTYRHTFTHSAFATPATFTRAAARSTVYTRTHWFYQFICTRLVHACTYAFIPTLRFGSTFPLLPFNIHCVCQLVPRFVRCYYGYSHIGFYFPHLPHWLGSTRCRFLLPPHCYTFCHRLLS